MADVAIPSLPALVTPNDADVLPASQSGVTYKVTRAQLRSGLETSGTASAAVSAHAGVTTSIHGIADTSALYSAGGTDVAVADGGTGASTAAAARTNLGVQETLIIPIGDETTAITTGNGKVSFRMPFALTVTGVRASLVTASSSGIPTFDINESGVSILSTKLTVDASERTSTTAVTAAVISDTALADDAEITIDVDVAGTGAAGAKIAIIGTRP